MSRAFTKEREDLPEPLVELHAAGDPVRLTPAGHASLQARLAAAASDAERRRIEHLLADAVIVGVPAERTTIGFGATVDVHAAAIGVRRFTIVGEHEANVASGRISETSPLGIALAGARAGDVVTWRRPAGDVALAVDAVTYDEVVPERGE